MSSTAPGIPSPRKQNQSLLSTVDTQNSSNQDPRIKSFDLVFPLKKPANGLKPLRTYHGEINIEVTEPVAVNQLNLTFEGWERVDFGTKVGASRRPICRSTEDLLQTSSSVVDTIVDRSVFSFTFSTPNVNFPTSMESAICEISYSITATLVGASDAASHEAASRATACANNIGTLATSTLPVQMAPRVLPSGVGWLKPLIMRDGVMLAEPIKRRFRRQTIQKAMNICVQVRNHCCTLGEAISVDVDATMLQSDRVLTFVRAAVIEQVALKTSVQDEEALAAIRGFLSGQGTANSPTVILAERTLNRKVSEIDPSMLTTPSASDWGTSTPSVNVQKRRQKNAPPLVGLNGIQNLLIRVPRKDVCTADGFILNFSHVLRLTFGLTSRPSSSGNFDTKYTTKDIPLRLVTSKFGDVGRASQVEINKRLSALTMESDGSAASEAYGYLLSENSRALRPESLESFGSYKNVPAPILLAVPDAMKGRYTPVPRPGSSSGTTAMSKTMSVAASRVYSLNSAIDPDSELVSVSPTPADERGFQYGPLPPIPQALPTPQIQKSSSTTDIQGSVQITEGAAEPENVDADQRSVGGDNDNDNESSALYMTGHNSSSNNNMSWSGDEDRFQTCRQQQRDTLVEVDLATASSQQQNSSLQSFHSFGSLGSFKSNASAHASKHTNEPSIVSNPQDSQGSDTLSAQNSANSLGSCKRLNDENKDDRAVRMNDKRGSAQSQSDTIVCSPPIEQHDVFGKEAVSASSVPELKLIPSIPAIKSLDEMTRDFFGNSSSMAGGEYFR
ncbi:hypothetical protein EV179_000481 [Coemansia sp. RSA 487]|nr:hypothetical protein EV179_000481 [Coemansia sp. RSA 487]